MIRVTVARSASMLAGMNRAFATIVLTIAAMFAVVGRGLADDGAVPAAAPVPLPSLAPVCRKITPAVVRVESAGHVTTTTVSQRSP